MSRNIFCLLFLSCLIFGCEKDDICNQGTPGTPNVVIRFFDKDSPEERKAAENISIKEINQEQIYYILNSDSVTIPMDLSKNFTRYAFILPSSTASLTIADTLQFNHTNRGDIYSRRACGFSAEYQLDTPAITAIGSITWYAYSVIQLDTIRNEEQAHLFIYH
jgi:hypothetical protein